MNLIVVNHFNLIVITPRLYTTALRDVLGEPSAIPQFLVVLLCHVEPI